MRFDLPGALRMPPQLPASEPSERGHNMKSKATLRKPASLARAIAKLQRDTHRLERRFDSCRVNCPCEAYTGSTLEQGPEAPGGCEIDAPGDGLEVLYPCGVNEVLLSHVKPSVST